MKKLASFLLAAALMAAPGFAQDGGKKEEKKNDKPAVITARVVDAKKKPAASAKVKIKSLDGAVVAEAVTDKKGEFQVKITAPAGDYLVAIDAADAAPFEDKILLEPGKEQRVEVKLLSVEEGAKNVAIRLYNEAADSFRKQDWATAKVKFTEALATAPDMPEPRLGLADIALTEGNTAEAIVQVEAFLKVKPDDVQGKKLAYSAYLRAGQQEKAKAISAELGDSKLNAGLAIDYYNQGALASQKGDFQTAVTKFKEATDLDPNLAEAWAGMGSVHYNQGNFAEALVNADKALALKPALPAAMRSKFLALDGLGRKEEAGKAWDAYAPIDKKGALDLLVRSAEADFKNNDLKAAEASLLRVLALDPEDAQAHLQIGLVYAGTNPAKAKEHLQKFIKLAPDHPEVPTAKDILSFL
jgi:tetratricopeptide (TPR) repeat protein